MTKTLKEEIIEESKRLGIDKIGFTTAEPFDYLKESLEELLLEYINRHK